MNAGELCIRSVYTADPEESVVDAAQRMTREGVGDLVVVEQIGGRAHPIGIVTDRDLVTNVLAQGTPASLELTVADVMHAGPVTAYEDEPVEAVLGRLKAHSIRRIPIIDRTGALQGILTVDDIVAWIGEQIEDAAAIFEHQATSPS